MYKAHKVPQVHRTSYLGILIKLSTANLIFWLIFQIKLALSQSHNQGSVFTFKFAKGECWFEKILKNFVTGPFYWLFRLSKDWKFLYERIVLFALDCTTLKFCCTSPHPIFKESSLARWRNGSSSPIV